VHLHKFLSRVVMFTPQLNVSNLFLYVNLSSQDLTKLFGDHGSRGLERLSSRLHAIRRQRHLQEMRHAVFLEQARQHIANQRDSELLARQAEFASRKARAFASLLGHADEWAAKHEHSNDLESFDSKKRPEPCSALLAACL
jgi:hypothetical protein